MKKVIFPIICAVLLPVIFLLKINPKMEVVGIVMLVGIGIGIGVGINKILFKEKNLEKETKTETK
jgi:hypothetical protein